MTQADLLDYTTAGGGHASLKGVGQAIRKGRAEHTRIRQNCGPKAGASLSPGKAQKVFQLIN